MFAKLSIHEYKSEVFGSDLLISYKGPVNNIIVADISHDIRNKLYHIPKSGRKVFSTFIELAQNVLYYSAEKVYYADNEDSVGSISIVDKGDHYQLFSGNLMESMYVEELEASCQFINSLDREELRNYKRERRNMPPRKRSKGAGIGLIQIALSANSPLYYEFVPVNEHFTYFQLSVIIEKVY